VPVRRRGLERSTHSFGPAFNDAAKHHEGGTRAVSVKQESDCFGTLRRFGELKVGRLVLQTSLDGEYPD
jgi:hypothetical protein